MIAENGSEGLLNPGVARDILAGDFRAVARLITLVENGALEATPYLRALFPRTGRALTLGITGAPGAGKSTVVDRLASHYRAQEKTVGIVAVDPTSPFTGGAILGDRIRMQSRSVDPGTFIRSMATRGHLGGLARATADVILVLDAAGFEVVLVETVGVGQDEIDVAQTAQITLVLLVPGMGDDIQAMKAGIMEVADIFLINKADRPGVDRTETELNALLSIHQRPDGWRPRVVRTVASEGQGIELCAAAVEEYRTFQQSSEFRKNRLVAIQKDRILEVVRERMLRRLLRDESAVTRIDELARRVAEREIDPFTAAEQLIRFAGLQ
jgi:LAO/AO transport system kinase